MKRLKYDDASVIFLISRVGTSEEARQFVQGLGKDPSIGSTVYVSPGDLAAKRAVYQKSGDNNAYTVLVSIMTAVPLLIVYEYTLTICSS
jgi:hypothetical protein